MENGVAMESTSLRSLLFHFFIKQRAKGVCLRLVICILDSAKNHQKGAEYVRIELSVEFFFGHFLKWI